MNRIVVLALAAISIVSLNQAVRCLRHAFFTLPFGPVITRKEYPVRFSVGVALLAVACVVSGHLLTEHILGLGAR